MRALMFGVCLALAACGQNAEAPASGAATAETAAFEIPVRYEPIIFGQANVSWFVCDTVGGSRIFVGTAPDENGAFELREFEKGQATPARTLQLTLFRDPALAEHHYSFREDDGVVQFNDTFADAWQIPIDLVGIGLEGAEACRLMSRTLMTAFTAQRSFVIRDMADGSLEYLGYDASGWQDAGYEQADNGARTNNASVRAAGSQTQNGPDNAQWEFPAGSAYLYRVTVPASGAEATLEVLRNGEVVTREPIIAMQLGAVQ